MKRPPVRVVVIALVAAIALASILLLQTSPAARSARDAESRREAARDPRAGAIDAQTSIPAQSVDSLVVRDSESRTVIDVSGVLEPVRRVVIGAEVSGRVIAIEAREHTGVQEGDLLLRLDPALPQAAVERARAALLRAEASRRLAASEVERQRQLSRQGVASTAELDRAESEDRSADAQVAEARAALLDAETRLAKSAIRAPFTGVVSSLDLEPGAYLNPGEPVAEMADLSEVEIEVGLSDREIGSIHDGDRVRVSVEALSGRGFDGRVVHPARTADALTRKFAVAVRVPNPDGLLLPGMLGRVRFELGDSEPVVWVPRRSVFREFDLDYVYVLEPLAADEGPGHRVVRRRVETRAVPFRPESLEITLGLEAGTRIATSGTTELREGSVVALRSIEGGTASAGIEALPGERARTGATP
jgi:RND family efflux transporter MFP subunit